MEKYLNQIPAHVARRIRYNPASMLKTVLFGFMTYGYISLRELEDNCKVNLRFMYLMEHKTPSYRTSGYFINEILKPSVEELFSDINKKIFAEQHDELAGFVIKIETNTEYVPAYFDEIIDRYTQIQNIDENSFVHGRGHHKTPQQRHFERF
ncbi:transposase [Selenomonas sp. ND2010]|uniref:transposase n=1 Tax=Selenomonas sp. ND2010 TaxID=1410618 RepID=UPI0018CC6FEF|nr:transposase [Selenomonas sp. ND2010]